MILFDSGTAHCHYLFMLHYLHFLHYLHLLHYLHFLHLFAAEAAFGQKCIFIQFHAGAAFSSVRATFEKIPYRIFSKAARFLENGGRRAENAYLCSSGCINIQFWLLGRVCSGDRR